MNGNCPVCGNTYEHYATYSRGLSLNNNQPAVVCFDAIDGDVAVFWHSDANEPDMEAP